MSKSIVSWFLSSSVNQILNDLTNQFGVVFNTHNILTLNHHSFKFSVFGSIIPRLNVVDFTNLPHCLEELISRARKLGFEVREPKDLSINVAFKKFANLSFKVVVDNVLHVNCIKVVGPRVEDLKALMLNVLFSISFNVFPEKFKRGLVSLDRIAQIIIVNLFFVVSQK